MTIEDLTPERVSLAYQRTGLWPISAAWAVETEEEVKCACAISAVAIDEGKLTFEQIEMSEDARDLIATTFGLGHCDVDEFSEAFDGDVVGEPDGDDLSMAQMLGLLCRERIKPITFGQPDADEDAA